MARSVVGIGEASHTPAGSSLVADYFGPKSRGRAMSVIGVAAGLGLGGGLIVGGAIGLHCPEVGDGKEPESGSGARRLDET